MQYPFTIVCTGVQESNYRSKRRIFPKNEAARNTSIFILFSVSSEEISEKYNNFIARYYTLFVERTILKINR